MVFYKHDINNECLLCNFILFFVSFVFLKNFYVTLLLIILESFVAALVSFKIFKSFVGS